MALLHFWGACERGFPQECLLVAVILCVRLFWGNLLFGGLAALDLGVTAGCWQVEVCRVATIAIAGRCLMASMQS